MNTRTDTDLSLLYEIAQELAIHLQHSLLHLIQAQELTQLGLQIINDRLDPNDSEQPRLHADFDNRALVEILVFPGFFLEKFRQIMKTAEALVESVEPYNEFMVAVSEQRPKAIEDHLNVSFYPHIWTNEGVRLAQQLQQDIPARKILANLYRDQRSLDRVYELYQSEAFSKRFRAGTDPEPPSESERSEGGVGLQDWEKPSEPEIPDGEDWESDEDSE